MRTHVLPCNSCKVESHSLSAILIPQRRPYQSPCQGYRLLRIRIGRTAAFLRCLPSIQRTPMVHFKTAQTSPVLFDLDAAELRG